MSIHAARKSAAALIAAVAVVAGIYVVRAHRVATRAASVDAPVPALTLLDLSGHTIDTSSYKGKVVLVNFWAAWCTPCREEIPQFVSLQEKYRARGFQAVGISMDDPEGVLRDFCREYKVNYPVVKGNQKIAEQFGGVLGLPTTFLIGRDGHIHAKYAGATDFPKLEQEIAALLTQTSDPPVIGVSIFALSILRLTTRRCSPRPPFDGTQNFVSSSELTLLPAATTRAERKEAIASDSDL